jgi:uncharacterized membrane protein YgaE (UPF0421/DUF939 family)
MLPARRITGSLATSAVGVGLALVVVAIFGVVNWVATIVATVLIVAAMLVRGRF